MDDLQSARLAQNEDVFREINERVNEIAESHGTSPHLYEFYCECADIGCVEQVALTLTEYQHIRAEPTRFVVKRNHVIREIEHAVDDRRGSRGHRKARRSRENRARTSR